MDRKEMNKIIFQNTEYMCKTDAALSDATKKSVSGQRFIAESEKIPGLNLNIYKKQTRICLLYTSDAADERYTV